MDCKTWYSLSNKI